MADQTSTVAGIVQIAGQPAARTVRAFSYDAIAHQIDGAEVALAKSLGHAKSDPATGTYEISLLGGYADDVFVVAFDDYGKPFTPNLALAPGERIHPSTPSGYVYECDAAGNLPTEEPAWVNDTGTSQLYGTASMIARQFYRPVVHGPIRPLVAEAKNYDEHWSKVVSLLHFDGPDGSTAIIDQTGRTWTATGAVEIGESKGGFGGSALFGGSNGYIETPIHDDLRFGGDDFTIELFFRPITLATANQYRGIIGNRRNSGTFAFTLYQNQNNTGISFRFANGAVILGDPRPLVSGEWYHVAATRAGDAWRLFVNGELVSIQFNTISIPSVTASVNLGRLDDDKSTTPYAFHGNMDEVRITKGVARYTETFTPPDKPFPDKGPA